MSNDSIPGMAGWPPSGLSALNMTQLVYFHILTFFTTFVPRLMRRPRAVRKCIVSRMNGYSVCVFDTRLYERLVFSDRQGPARPEAQAWARLRQAQAWSNHEPGPGNGLRPRLDCGKALKVCIP
jgi:hypothetical protein